MWSGGLNYCGHGRATLLPGDSGGTTGGRHLARRMAGGGWQAAPAACASGHRPLMLTHSRTLVGPHCNPTVLAHHFLPTPHSSHLFAPFITSYAFSDVCNSIYSSIVRTICTNWFFCTGCANTHSNSLHSGFTCPFCSHSVFLAPNG